MLEAVCDVLVFVMAKCCKSVVAGADLGVCLGMDLCLYLGVDLGVDLGVNPARQIYFSRLFIFCIHTPNTPLDPTAMHSASLVSEIHICPRLRLPATAVSVLAHATPQRHGIRDKSRYARTSRMRYYTRLPTLAASISQKPTPM